MAREEFVSKTRLVLFSHPEMDFPRRSVLTVDAGRFGQSPSID
jgi:hypothetical protein